jgi:membrane protease YdiL (CAAX protease family)
MLRDVIGFLRLLALILFAAALPGCFVLPAHYVGLLRRERGAPEVDSRWNLRHAWTAFGSMTVGNLLALYLFGYEELRHLSVSHVKANLSQTEMANVGLAIFACTTLTAISFSHRSDWKRLSPAAWMNRLTLTTAVKCVLLLIIVAWTNRILVGASGGSDSGTEGIAFSTRAVLIAIRHTYGAAALILVAIVAVPISEELIFRGVILEGLARHLPFWWANVVQGCLFALAHDDLGMAPFFICMAMVAGVLRRRTQSLATGTVMHAINNVLASFALGH